MYVCVRLCQHAFFLMDILNIHKDTRLYMYTTMHLSGEPVCKSIFGIQADMYVHIGERKNLLESDKMKK